MTNLKLRLLAGSAAGALVLAATGPVQAFDEVHWEWNKQIREIITKDIDIDVRLRPTGVVELQDLQISIGDVEAESTVTNVQNNPPSGSGTVTLEGGLTFAGPYFDNGNVDDPFEADIGGENSDQTFSSDLPSSTVTGTGDFAGATLGVFGGLTEDNDAFDPIDGPSNDGGLTFTADISGLEVTVPASASLFAPTELPEVESIATAVANNVTVDSDYMVEMHNTQIAIGGFPGDSVTNGDGQAVADTFNQFYSPETGGELVGTTDPDTGETTYDLVNQGYSGNLSVASALALMVAGAGGLIDGGDVTATSTVGGDGMDGIVNASVVSNATAVANNKSVTIEAATATDGVFIGDVTQFAYMDVSATSDVSNVSLNNYTALGLNGGSGTVLNRPIVSSVATAVGNNLSISVSAPTSP